MSGRRLNLKGPRDKEQSRKPRGKQRQKSNGLNALAIAEKQYPSKSKIRAHRYGEDEGDYKRKREDGPQPPSKRARTGEADSESDDDGGSDSDGNEWQMGKVDSDDDSELDSDEAMGSSDEERFEGFAFRGSSSKSKPRKKPTKKVDLSEDAENSDGSSGDDSDDDLGDDAVDLATAWDMNAEEDEAGPQEDSEASADEIEDEDDDDEDDLSDNSGLSLSDDEEDKANSRGLSKLRNFIDTMETDLTNSTSNRKSVTVQEQGKPTEFGLTPSRKLTATDLIPTITDSRLKGSLKHLEADSSTQNGKASAGGGKLEAPLAKRQQDRINRAAAFDKSKATLDRWVDTVKANRQAPHLSFPLAQPDAQQPSQITEMKPRTDLENTIQNILLESGLAEPKAAEDKIQEFEELEAKKIPLEEIQARRAELRKARDLLFREEIRSKRIKKIKSKAYRRVHRKQREKQEFQERQALEDAGVDMEEEERERNERARAEARMGARHRESKWAKSVKQGGRAAWDEDARLGMADIARRDEELQKRIKGKRIDDEDDGSMESSSSESEDDGFFLREDADSDVEKEKLDRKLRKLETTSDDAPASGQGSRLLSMKFMQNAEAAQKASNDAELKSLSRGKDGREHESDSEDGGQGRQRFGVKSAANGKQTSAPVHRNQFEERLDSDDEDRMAAEDEDIDIVVDKKANQESASIPKKLRKLETRGKETKQAENSEENPWLTQTKRNNIKAKATATNEPADLILANNLGGANAKASKKSVAKPAEKGKVSRNGDADDEEGSDEDEERVPVLLKNTDLVKKAFAGDEVLEDFTEEKLETTKDEDDKVVDNTLPGWGSWAGEGISNKKKKQEKDNRFLTTVEGVKADKRKDAKLDKVIINEKRVKKVSRARFSLYHSSCSSRSCMANGNLRTKNTLRLNCRIHSKRGSSMKGLFVFQWAQSGRRRILSRRTPSLV